jgi:tetratricopeptide (TPR) repeat protein
MQVNVNTTLLGSLISSLISAMLFLASPAAFAQAPGSPQPQQPGQQQPQQPNPGQPQDPNKPPAAAPIQMDSAPPVNAEEEAAIKQFRELPGSDAAKKDQAGEEFLTKYPSSRYRPEVYNWLVKGYLSTGQVEKMEAAGDKELQLNPNDPQTLAIVGSTLPRAMSASMSDADKEKRLDKAEQYNKKSLELLPTYPKPDNMTEEQFTAAKNQIAAMAYGGLGLVDFRRGKFQEAIPNLQQSAKLDTNPDPVNYFLLGVCNEKTSHFDDAVAAFTKCAAIPSGLQTNCKNGVDDAKKLATTQMSAPK